MFHYVLGFCSLVLLPCLVLGELGQPIGDSKPEDHLRCGMIHASGNNLDEAITEFSKAIELNPKYAEAYYERGVAQVRKSQHDRAIADFTEVVRLEPNKRAAYLSRGRAYCDKAQYELAVKDFTEAIRL